MTKDELLELADRCEREGASRKLDLAIAAAKNGGGHFPYCQAYTTSLDAAVTLVPEGFHWDMDTSGLEVASSVFDTKGRFLASADVEKHGRASTPALALCAAALRARAADMQARAVGAPHPSTEQKGSEHVSDYDGWSREDLEKEIAAFAASRDACLRGDWGPNGRDRAEGYARRVDGLVAALTRLRTRSCE